MSLAAPTHAASSDFLTANRLTYCGLLIVALSLPWVGNDYWALIATRAAICCIFSIGIL